MTDTFKTKCILSAVLIVLIISGGTLGYVFLEGWDFFDSFYMTIITLTTVGFGEVHPLSRVGKMFTIALIVGGVGTVFYALSTAAKFMLEGEFEEIFGRKRLEKKIKELRDHFIVCGYGRMGRIICRELREKKISFVVVEKMPDKLLDGQDVLLVEGDATRDEILKEVGIERAKGLISVLPTDAENLYVVLSARGLNPSLTIVARAGDEGSEQKLIRAGADRVVSPYYIGGLRIAHTVLKPAVVDFIEFATKSGNIDLQMEEIAIQENSGLVGRTLDDSGIGRELGIIVVAIKEGSGEMRFNPTYKTAIKAGDTLIALGEISKLKALEDMAMLQRQ
ncbi:MAG: potassium channel family protein [Thermodesulfovibrionales bacterium]